MLELMSKILKSSTINLGFPGGSSVKKMPAVQEIALQYGRPRFNPGVRKIP